MAATRQQVGKLMSRLLSTRMSSRTRETVQRMLRVDHAGEYGAVRIYEGQLAVLGGTGERDTLAEMREHEVEHLKKFDELLPKFRTRPSALLPLWHAGGVVLGAVPALLGKEAAYAVTVAVEQNICDHYNNQVRTLIELMEEEKQKRAWTMRQSPAAPESGAATTSGVEGETAEGASGDAEEGGVDEQTRILEELKTIFKKFRDEEQEHLETGLERGAERAPFYKTLSGAVGVVSKTAIWAAERV